MAKDIDSFKQKYQFFNCINNEKMIQIFNCLSKIVFYKGEVIWRSGACCSIPWGIFRFPAWTASWNILHPKIRCVRRPRRLCSISRRRFDSSSRRRFKYSLKFMPVSSLNFSEFRNIFHTMTIILYQLLVFNFMEYINISKDSEIKNVIDIYIRIESFKSYGLL